MRRNSNHLPKGKKFMLSRRASAIDVARYMKQVVRDTVNNPSFKEFARRNPMNEKQIFNYAYQSAIYEPDKPNDQVVKTPAATIREGKGNCVDYSTLIASLLKLNKIPGVFRMVEFKGDTMPSHIYPVTNRGIALDCVQGQSQSGELSKRLRRNKRGVFNNEPKYLSKFDTKY